MRAAAAIFVSFLLIILVILLWLAMGGSLESVDVVTRPSMGEITDVNIATVIKGDVLVWNGTEWVGAQSDDTSFTFVFLTFGDNQTGTQLIGSGAWLSIGAGTFTCTYENGPPDHMVVDVVSDFSAGSGWTGDSLEFTSDDKLSQATTEITKYPDDYNDAVTFYGIAWTLGESDTLTTSVQFRNDTRWGISSAGTLNDADVNGLAYSDLIEDNTQSFGTLVPGSGQYVILAYPDRLGTLGSTVFRFLNMTAGFSLQDLNPHVNSAGYSENYNVYKSNLANMGSGTFQTTGSLLNMVKYSGSNTGTYNAAFITDSLTSYDIDDNSSQTATLSNWLVSQGVTDYSFIAVPSRWNLNTSYFRYYTGTVEMQAGFTEVGSNISWQNLAGYSENYDIFKSVVLDLSNGSIGVGQSAIRQPFWYGASAVGSGFTETNVEALAYASIREDTDNTQTWGSFDPGAAEYVVLAVPARCAALQHGTDYETDGNQGTAFLFDGLTCAFAAAEVVSVTNAYGFTENYEVYPSTIVNPGSGSGSFVTSTTGTIAYQYWGTHTATSAAAWTLSDFNTMSSQGGGSSSTSTDITGNPQFTVDADDTYYIWFCYPKRLGTVDFYIGGFFTEFELETVSLTNFCGWTEDYYCWRSPTEGLQVTPVTTQ
jgi:hypothetical protein